MPVSTVARTLEDGLRLPAGIIGRGPDPRDQPDARHEYLLVERRRLDLRRAGHRRRRPGVPRAALSHAGRVTVGCGRVRHVPDVPPDAWSGVHRGPLRAGEWVRLTDSKGRRHNFCLEPGKRFFSNRGHLDHDEMIGREEGFTVTSSAGGEYLVFRPLLSEYVVSMPRGAAVVYPKDAAQIVAMADVFPGAHVVEAGVGSGALTCSLLRAVGPHGMVSSYERREEFAEVARRNVDSVLRRRPPRLAADDRRPRRGAAGGRGAVRPDHARHARALGLPGRRGRRARARAASSARTSPPPPSCPGSSRRSGCTAGSPSRQAWESLVRDWHVEGLAVRPGHKMIGHTAFLVTARRMAPGASAAAEEAAARARRLRSRLHRPPAARRTGCGRADG